MKTLIRIACLTASLVSLVAYGQNEWRDKWREMDYAVINGIELAYDDVGDGEVILFMHGGQGTPDSFSPVLSQPALSGYRKIVYHQRGHGQSSSSEPRLLLQDVMDAIGLLDRLDVESAHIVAHSWAGGIATTLAVLEPDRVLSLVLLEPGVNRPRVEGLDPGNDLGERYRELDQQVRAERNQNRDRLATLTIDGLIDNAMISLGEGIDGEEKLTVFYPDQRAQMRRFFEWRLASADADPPPEPEIPYDWPPSLVDFNNLSLPVLWVYGENPGVRFQLDNLFWRALFPSMEEATVQGVGHALHMLKPAEVAQLISEFYAEHRID